MSRDAPAHKKMSSWLCPVPLYLWVFPSSCSPIMRSPASHPLFKAVWEVGCPYPRRWGEKKIMGFKGSVWSMGNLSEGGLVPFLLLQSASITAVISSGKKLKIFPQDQSFSKGREWRIIVYNITLVPVMIRYAMQNFWNFLNWQMTWRK